jgi:hypothetical protein
MVIFSFANEKSRIGIVLFHFGCIGFSIFWCVLVFTYVYSRYALCLLLQIWFVAALDIKMHDEPTVSSINSLLSDPDYDSHNLMENVLIILKLKVIFKLGSSTTYNGWR